MLSGPERNWSLANHTRDQLFSENNTQMRRIGKPTCMKLYKFNGTNPPPDSAVGFKHFRNTSTYNNWVFGKPLYQLASHLYIALYCEFRSTRMEYVVKGIWYSYSSFRNWNYLTTMFVDLTLIERLRRWHWSHIDPLTSERADETVVQQWKGKIRRTWIPLLALITNHRK